MKPLSVNHVAGLLAAVLLASFLSTTTTCDEKEKKDDGPKTAKDYIRLKFQTDRAKKKAEEDARKAREHEFYSLHGYMMGMGGEYGAVLAGLFLGFDIPGTPAATAVVTTDAQNSDLPDSIVDELTLPERGLPGVEGLVPDSDGLPPPTRDQRGKPVLFPEGGKPGAKPAPGKPDAKPAPEKQGAKPTPSKKQ